jgi:hypothetical protein
MKFAIGVVFSANTKLLACGYAGGSVTHTNNSDKSSVSAQWDPYPEGAAGVTML